MKDFIKVSASLLAGAGITLGIIKVLNVLKKKKDTNEDTDDMDLVEDDTFGEGLSRLFECSEHKSKSSNSKLRDSENDNQSSEDDSTEEKYVPFGF